MDDEHVCGVCGASLSESPTVSLDEAEQVKSAQSSPGRQTYGVDWASITGLGLGIALLAAGVFEFYLQSLWGFVLVIPGLLLAVSVMNAISRTPYKPYGVWGGRGARSSLKRALEESRKERDKESGAAD